AQAFHLDSAAIDSKLNALAQRSPSTIQPVNYQVAGATPAGMDLLERARNEIKAGKTAMARQLCEEAYKPSYGVQQQARDLLNRIDAEEFAQKRLEVDRAFLAGYDAFLNKEFKKAASIFAHLDERLLSEQRQKTLRELAMTKEMMQAAAPAAPQAPVQLV